MAAEHIEAGSYSMSQGMRMGIARSFANTASTADLAYKKIENK